MKGKSNKEGLELEQIKNYDFWKHVPDKSNQILSELKTF